MNIQCPITARKASGALNVVNNTKLKGISKNALFPRLLRRLRARILMYVLCTGVLRAVPSRLEVPTFGALTQKLLFLEVP